MIQLGTVIRKLRVKKRLSQSELAQLIEIPSQSKISAWESEKSLPNIFEAYKLAIVFDLSLDGLLNEMNS